MSALGVCIPACNGADTPPHGQTDTCENMTFANFFADGKNENVNKRAPFLAKSVLVNKGNFFISIPSTQSQTCTFWRFIIYIGVCGVCICDFLTCSSLIRFQQSWFV